MPTFSLAKRARDKGLNEVGGEGMGFAYGGGDCFIVQTVSTVISMFLTRGGLYGLELRV